MYGQLFGAAETVLDTHSSSTPGHTSKKYTWIDHILCNMNDMSRVKICSIIQEEAENFSDHLPVRIEFSLLLEKKIINSLKTEVTLPNQSGQMP